MFTLLFLGGWFLPLGLYAHILVMFLKVVSFAWFIILTRATLPRVRIKALASITWSHLLPFSSSALPTYLWLGVVSGAFRICEYCVYGTEMFRTCVRRFYYLGRSFWHTASSEQDLRIDTALGSFAYMRQFADWGQPGKARVIGNTGVPYMTYPENQRLASSIQLAGGTAVEGERHTAAPFDAERADQNLNQVTRPDGESKLYFEHDATAIAKKQAPYWQEMLAGDFPQFDEWARSIPDREIISRYVRDDVGGRNFDEVRSHSDPMDPYTQKSKWATKRKRLERDTLEVLPAAGLTSALELADDTFLRYYGDEPGAVDYLATNKVLRENYSGRKYEPGKHRSWGEATYPWGGVQTNPYTSPSGFNEFMPLIGATKDVAALSEEQRFAFWESLADEACEISAETGVDAYDMPYFNRLIRAGS